MIELKRQDFGIKLSNELKNDFWFKGNFSEDDFKKYTFPFDSTCTNSFVDFLKQKIIEKAIDARDFELEKEVKNRLKKLGIIFKNKFEFKNFCKNRIELVKEVDENGIFTDDNFLFLKDEDNPNKKQFLISFNSKIKINYNENHLNIEIG